MILSHSVVELASRVKLNIPKGYNPGIIANLPQRGRKSHYQHGGHEVGVIREQYPHFTEVSGGFAELIGGIKGGDE